MELIRLSVEDKERIKELFISVFTKEPWNDDWSNEEQLEHYIMELIGNPNSLALGYVDGSELVAMALGHIKHWYEATELYIDELCVRGEMQGKGIGGQFLSEMENYLQSHDINAIFLLTERDVPAYGFYQKQGFCELESNVAFVKGIGKK